jgi:hypothetical protein
MTAAATYAVPGVPVTMTITYAPAPARRPYRARHASAGRVDLPPRRSIDLLIRDLGRTGPPSPRHAAPVRGREL